MQSPRREIDCGSDLNLLFLEPDMVETADRKATPLKGACTSTYDVCSGRGEGGTPKADVVREVA